MTGRLTVFVGTYNRIETLQRTITSFRRLTTPHELVIVDNGTDHPAALELLERLARRPEVRKVYQLRKIGSMDELTDNFNVAVVDQRRMARAGDWFAITDADVCFDASSPRSLDAYLKLAAATGKAVGPHTHVGPGIPSGYPLRTRVLVAESRLLYRDSMRLHERIPYSAWPIDTTFHLFPATRSFRRLQMDTLRGGPPYDALHLDWYLDIFNPTVENGIYIRTDTPIGSWGRNWIAGYWRHFQEHGAESAFAMLRDEPRNEHDDLCITSFMLSWCHQFGVGCPVDVERSLLDLDRAIPHRFAELWEREEDWLAMIYRDDFSSLGWRWRRSA